MKRLTTYLLICVAATAILKAQSLEEVSPKLMVKVLLDQSAGVRGLFHEISDSSISILVPFSLAKKSVRKGALEPGVFFASYKFAEVAALQLKRKDPGGAMVRGAAAGFLAAGIPFTLLAAASGSPYSLAVGIIYGVPVAGFVGLIRAISGNFVRIYDSRKVGESGIDEVDLRTMKELVSKYKY